MIGMGVGECEAVATASAVAFLGAHGGLGRVGAHPYPYSGLAKEAPTMSRAEHDIVVDAPLRAVYNQWTQFEEFPLFMDSV